MNFESQTTTVEIIWDTSPLFGKPFIQIRGSCISTMRICLESPNLQNLGNHLSLVLYFWRFFIHSKHFGKIWTFQTSLLFTDVLKTPAIPATTPLVSGDSAVAESTKASSRRKKPAVTVTSPVPSTQSGSTTVATMSPIELHWSAFGKKKGGSLEG